MPVGVINYKLPYRQPQFLVEVVCAGRTLKLWCAAAAMGKEIAAQFRTNDVRRRLGVTRTRLIDVHWMGKTARTRGNMAGSYLVEGWRFHKSPFPRHSRWCEESTDGRIGKE